MIRRNPKTDRKVRESKKTIVAISPKQSLRDATGQAGGAQRKKKVVVAMSGGVDSSVAAALLKRAGPAPEQARYGVNFDVIGVFMKFWKAPDDNGLIEGWNRCCSPEAENRARQVAKILDIPFYVFNFEKEFKKRIVDYFLKEYKRGLTPNPCVVCNKEIKFGLFLEKALKLGADFIATGHYARLRREVPNSLSQAKRGTPRRVASQIPKYKLLRAKDKDKDQSYFLWQLNQKQLKRILFPIGDFNKSEVRKMARRFKLPVFNVAESQEICFIPRTLNDFLRPHLKPKPGKIITSDGKIAGRHQGLFFYTIGQRKGIGLAGGPWYVLDKNIKKNLLIITRKEKDLNRKELTLKNVNWISGEEPKLPITIMAKIRYRHEPALSRLSKLKTKNYKLFFNKSQRAITPGQSVVFYLPADLSTKALASAEVLAKAGKGEELFGGGIIS
jgi:tRNA-specific 2-thiouridylase